MAALDIVGPAAAFAAAICETGGEHMACYEIAVLGTSKRKFITESGIAFLPAYSLDTAPELDTLIIPGGAGLRRVQLGAFLNS